MRLSVLASTCARKNSIRLAKKCVNRRLNTCFEKTKHRDAPAAERQHTKGNAIDIGNRAPASRLRNILPANKIDGVTLTVEFRKDSLFSSQQV